MEQKANARKRIVYYPTLPGEGRTENERRKIRVAAYCRVSSASDEQMHSIQAQSDYYTQYISSNADYEPVGIFSDAAAIIGLNQKPEANGRRFSPFSLVSAHFKTNGGCNCLI